MGKKLTAAMVLVVLVLSLGTAGASARWDKGAECDDDFYVSGTTAHCYLAVTASDSAKITATVQIIRINSDGSRTAVKAWNGLTGTGSLTFSETHTSSLLGPQRHLPHVLLRRCRRSRQHRGLCGDHKVNGNALFQSY